MNELKEQYDQALAFGESYCINDWIKIKNPKISDIIRFGEKKYYQLAYAFTATPSDYKHQLFDIGRDYEEVDDYELFIVTRLTLPKKIIASIFPSRWQDDMMALT